MARTIETQIFQYDELSDKAKAKARDWYRSVDTSNDSAEFIIDDAVRFGEIMGISFATDTVKLYGGGTRQQPRIHWRISYSQGDGAEFEGTYRYAKGALEQIRKEAPQDKELQGIVERLQSAQKRHGYRLTASISTHMASSTNSMNMRVEVEHDNENYDLGEDDAEIRGALREFADWIYDLVREAYEYRNEDAQVEETIRANEYEFTEDGEHWS